MLRRRFVSIHRTIVISTSHWSVRDSSERRRSPLSTSLEIYLRRSFQPAEMGDANSPVGRRRSLKGDVGSSFFLSASANLASSTPPASGPAVSVLNTHLHDRCVATVAGKKNQTISSLVNLILRRPHFPQGFDFFRTRRTRSNRASIHTAGTDGLSSELLIDRIYVGRR